MQKPILAPFLRTSAIYLALAASPALAADARTSGLTTSGSTSVTTGTATRNAASVPPSSRLYARYRDFVGSDNDTRSLIQGLRYGELITLGGVTAESRATAFIPPTRPMGWDNVDRALGLAQAVLASWGITQPTAAQLKLALNGGTLVSANGSTRKVQGILAMRSNGMGWGDIANAIQVAPEAWHANGAIPAVASSSTAASSATESNAMESNTMESNTTTGAGWRWQSDATPSTQAGRLRLIIPTRRGSAMNDSNEQSGQGFIMNASGAIMGNTASIEHSHAESGIGNR